MGYLQDLEKRVQELEERLDKALTELDFIRNPTSEALNRFFETEIQTNRMISDENLLTMLNLPVPWKETIYIEKGNKGICTYLPFNFKFNDWGDSGSNVEIRKTTTKRFWRKPLVKYYIYIFGHRQHWENPLIDDKCEELIRIQKKLSYLDSCEKVKSLNGKFRLEFNNG